MFDQSWGWFILTISSTIIYGVINFMYKVAAEHKCPSNRIVNTSASAISLISLLVILITQSEFTNLQQILFFAAINSSFFALGTIVKIQSLKHIDASYAFPLTKLNSVFLIIYALILFDENPTWTQWLGITVSFGMLAYISINVKNSGTKEDTGKRQILGLLFAVLAAFSTSISMLTGKFASTEVPKINYIFVSYTLVMIYTIIINKSILRKSKKPTPEMRKKILLFGVIIGVLNLVGYYLILSAFASGPLSLIQGISSNAFIIPIVLALIIYKEKFTYKNAIILTLAIISILLIKLEF